MSTSAVLSDASRAVFVGGNAVPIGLKRDTIRGSEHGTTNAVPSTENMKNARAIPTVQDSNRGIMMFSALPPLTIGIATSS